MLTVEIKVNGTVVKHVYAHNMDGLAVSEYEVVVADTVPYNRGKPSIQEFNITHDRADGIGRLVSAILEVAGG